MSGAYYIIESYKDGEWSAEHVGMNRALWLSLEMAERAATALCEHHGYKADRLRIMHIERLTDEGLLQ